MEETLRGVGWGVENEKGCKWKKTVRRGKRLGGEKWQCGTNTGNRVKLFGRERVKILPVFI